MMMAVKCGLDMTSHDGPIPRHRPSRPPGWFKTYRVSTLNVQVAVELAVELTVESL